MLAALLAGSLSGHAAPRPPALSILGNYTLQFRGALAGSGTATVAAKTVMINGNLRDAAGNSAQFTVAGMPLLNGRFSGEKQFQQSLVRIWGRVDPPSGAVRTARISCTFSASNPTGEQYGRIIGSRR